ncbi:MAG: hypothetical protein ACRDN0_12210, partial [Trebonia sp.]
EKAQMSALEQKVDSGQISGVSLRISEQIPGAFAALARKHQVPDAQFTIYRGGLTAAHEIGDVDLDAPITTPGARSPQVIR